MVAKAAFDRGTARWRSGPARVRVASVPGAGPTTDTTHVIAGPLSTAEGSYVALTRARATHPPLRLERRSSNFPSRASKRSPSWRIGSGAPNPTSRRSASRSSHEQHIEREHVQLTLDVDQARESVHAPRVERDRLQAIVDSYPRDTADHVESLERDVERFRANAETWREEAERFRGELAALGPFARRGTHASSSAPRSPAASEEHRSRARPSAAAPAKLAEIQGGPDSPQRWEAEHPDVRERLRDAEQAFEDAVDREADRAIANPGAHLTRVLGERPTHDQPAAREAWEQAGARSRGLPHHLRARPGRADRARRRT